MLTSITRPEAGNEILVNLKMIKGNENIITLWNYQNQSSFYIFLLVFYLMIRGISGNARRTSQKICFFFYHTIAAF